MKTKIFIDFDGTIFNTAKFRAGLFDIFKKAGFLEEEIESTYQLEFLNYCYSPKAQMKRLAEMHPLNQTLFLSRLSKLYLTAPDCIFSDATDFLTQIDRDEYEVDLFTLGDLEFQRHKFTDSGVSQLFDNAYFTTEQKWLSIASYVKKEEKFIFVDDRGDVVFEIGKRYRKAFCVEINRGDFKDPMEPAKDFGNITVRDFKQLEKYLRLGCR